MLRGSAMASSSENQQLAQWLQVMGCPVDLSPEDLQKLNTPNMQPVWRHLRRHVMPVQNVQTIRKNLLLAKLKKQKTVPGSFRHFKVESLQELTFIQNLSEAQDEIDILKDETKVIDDNLQSASSSLASKLAEKENKMQNLREIERKSTLLSLKVEHVKKDIKKLDEEMENAKFFESNPNQLSYSELKSKKLQVCNLVQKFSLFEKADDDYVCEFIASTLGFPPSVILDGILAASSQVLRSLQVSDFLTPTKHLDSSIFRKHLDTLHQTVFKNEVELCSLLQKFTEAEVVLEKEKTGLLSVMGGTCSDTSLNCVTELVDKLVQNIIMTSKLKKLKELKEELDDSCSDSDCTKFMIHNLGEKKEELMHQVDINMASINKLLEEINKSKVTSTRREVLEACTQVFSNFQQKLKPNLDEENTCPFVSSENMIAKEVEMFQKTPLVALTRKWQDSSELVPTHLWQNLSNKHALLGFLVQSAPKNIIKSVLEKLYWSAVNSKCSPDK